jgi:hypothetical protein
MPPAKDVGEPCAREPHARFEAAAGGNQTSRANPRRTVQAPPADPTTQPSTADVTALDEPEEHGKRVSARPFTSAVAVVDAGRGRALGDRPLREPARSRWRRPHPFDSGSGVP